METKERLKILVTSIIGISFAIGIIFGALFTYYTNGIFTAIIGIIIGFVFILYQKIKDR